MSTVNLLHLQGAHTRPRRLPLLAVLVVVLMLALGVTSAQAVPLSQVATFGSPGSGAGQLSEPHGVAVNKTTGDVYVADTANHRVDEFDAHGNFILTFGQGVDQTTGENICTAASGDMCGAGIPGSGEGKLRRPFYIAVDNSGGPSEGDVYVGDVARSAELVSQFDASGNFIASNNGSASLLGKPFRELAGIAVDQSGDLWVYDGEADEVFEFLPGGRFVRQWSDQVGGSNSGAPLDLAVGANEVYLINTSGRLLKFSLSGASEGAMTPVGVRPFALAVNPATDELYANMGGTMIEHYDASCVPIPFIIPSESGINELLTGCASVDSFGSGGAYAGIGLNPDTTTLYAAGPAGQVVVFGPPPSGAPVVDSEFATSAGSASATVEATVTPLGFDTTCQVQYVDGATFQGSGYAGASAVPCEPSDLGSSFANRTVDVHLSGLAAGTTFHFRFVTSNSAGTTDGPDHAFATEAPSSGLPDGRAYEMVTPPNKDPGEPYRFGEVAATEGGALAFFSFSALPGSLFSTGFYLATRGGEAWSSQSLVPPQSSEETAGASEFVGPEAYSSDLSKLVLADGFNQASGGGHDEPALVPGEPQGVQNLFVRDNTNGSYQLVSLNPVAGSPAEANFDASSADLGHVVFDESAQLTADAPAGNDNLYDWSGGSVRLVSGAAGATIAGPGGSPTANVLHAVSADGTRIFFQAEGNLYVRKDDTETVQVDAAHGAGPGGGGQFRIASADGSQVFFTDDASAGLTGDTIPGSGQNLYRFDVESGQLTDLTPAGEASVQGVSGAGEDGAYVYFVAKGTLASGATAGQPNLYVYHGGSLQFIASFGESFPETCTWEAFCLTAKVSADGTHIAFNSDRSLTAVDTAGLTQVYLYDATAGTLVCASCSRNGTRPSGVAYIEISNPMNQFSQRQNYLSRNLSADGSRLFFDTTQALVSSDSNERQDVYEYEQDGTGSCQTAGGCVFLLSSGTGSDDAYFVNASVSGSDVFIYTSQQLLAQDIDSAPDIYDVRVNGGLPAPATPAECSGDACRGPLGAAPAFGASGSATLSGAGNLTPLAPAAAVKPAVKVKPLTRAQKLEHARLACRRKPRRQRHACETQALRRYGPRSKAGRASVHFSVHGKGGK